MHPNVESIKSSDLEIVISPYDIPSTTPHGHPFHRNLDGHIRLFLLFHQKNI